VSENGGARARPAVQSRGARQALPADTVKQAALQAGRENRCPTDAETSRRTRS
jgi:hypothetical protein